jgi:diadenosine tetraphosphate (Ap4A) HIT family hydrolase
VGFLVGGPLIWQDEHVLVSANRPARPAKSFSAICFIETRRHARYIDELTDTEATTVGWAAARGAKAFRSTLDPEAVFSAIIGRGVPHFRQHVFVRHRGSRSSSTGWPAVSGPTLRMATRVQGRNSSHIR